jgi:hypothetical protein
LKTSRPATSMMRALARRRTGGDAGPVLGTDPRRAAAVADAALSPKVAPPFSDTGGGRMWSPRSTSGFSGSAVRELRTP